MQFLMELDDIYQPVRTNLLTRDPLPTIKTAFSIISREESHRGSNNVSKVPNVGFAAKSNNFNDNKKKFNKGPNPNLKCSYCNKIGHTVDKCFELNGYPPNYRSKPTKSSSQWGRSNNAASSGSGPSLNNTVNDKNSSSLNSLTADQFSKLLGLLNENKTDDTNKSNVGSKCFNSFFEYKNIFCFNSKLFFSQKQNWIIDSGANQHMVMSSDNMFNLVDVSEYNITVKHPNGTNAKVTQIGCFRLSDSVILKDVFVVPEYCVNLISVYKLAKDNKLKVVFNENSCYIQDSCLKKTLVTGRQTEGLYFCGFLLLCYWMFSL
ncbi:putative transcription factor interactor and regulator CCHC(Zn) family [Helianthus annuus]|nr:putative transcription factor interactor and regulator CCHC(Zn) family [Helianthus annuus]